VVFWTLEPSRRLLPGKCLSEPLDPVTLIA
jgi:hypothetical protein